MTTRPRPVIYFVESQAEVSPYLKTCEKRLLSANFDFVFEASSKKHKPGSNDIVLTIKCASPGALLQVSSLAVDCKAVCLVDGVVEWRNSYENPFHRDSKYQLYHENVFDYYLCIHEQSFRALASFGLPVIRLGTNYDESIACKAPDKVEKFLVTTAKQPFFDGFEKAILAQELKRVCHHLRDHGYEFKLRIFDQTLMLGLEQFKECNNTQESLEQAIASVDAVFTTPSTVSLDVFTLGKPVIHIDLRDGPLLLQSGWRLTPSYPIERVLHSISDDTRLKFQAVHLKPSEHTGADILNLTINDQKRSTRRTLAAINGSHLNVNVEIMLKRTLQKLGIFSWFRIRILSKFFESKARN